MKRYGAGVFLFLGLSVALVGCAKKSDESNLTGNNTLTGFDSLATTEEIASLPQVATSAQQTAVEVLPIEASPVTPSAVTPISSTGSDFSGLSYQQKIQTALKNAGFYQGAIDGKIGPASKKAIENFQKSNGLVVDGKVGPKTWTLLEPFLTKSADTTQPAAN